MPEWLILSTVSVTVFTLLCAAVVNYQTGKTNVASCNAFSSSTSHEIAFASGTAWNKYGDEVAGNLGLTLMLPATARIGENWLDWQIARAVRQTMSMPAELQSSMPILHTGYICT